MAHYQFYKNAPPVKLVSRVVNQENAVCIFRDSYVGVYGDCTHHQLTNISCFPVLFLAIIMMSQVPPNLSFFKIILYLSCIGNMLGSQGGEMVIRSARFSKWLPLGLYPPWNNNFWTNLVGTWVGYLGCYLVVLDASLTARAPLTPLAVDAVLCENGY